MTLDLLDFLTAPAGRELLAASLALAPTEANYLRCVSTLRKQFSAAQAQAALDLVIQRKKAERKFSRAAEMYFTRESLEVASGEAIAKYRAKRFAAYESVADLCCGIGGDSLGFAQSGFTVHAQDSDPLRLRMAELNAGVNGFTGRMHFQQADVLRDPLPDAPAMFADPGRRAEGRRFLSLNDYLPPPQAILHRLPAEFPIAFKLAPGVNLADAESLNAELEFIAVDGELKECVAWNGALKTCLRRATLLPSGETISADDVPLLAEPRAIGAFLYDPASAAVRAGLVPLLAEMLNAEPTDYTVQMLTSDDEVHSPWVQCYAVEAVLKWDAKAVNAALRANNIGRITPLHRGAAPDAEAFVKRWKLTGKEHCHTILTRSRGDWVVILARLLAA